MATEPIHPTKACNKCGAEKPATLEHFPPLHGGLRKQCRPCWREYERAYFWKNREKKREGAKRRWAKCDKEQARANIRAWKEANPEKARAIEIRRLARIKADPALRAKAAERVNRWRIANPEKEAERRRRSKETRPQAVAIYSRRYRERHLEKVKAKEKRYRKENYGKVIAQVQRRRARELGAEGQFTGHDVVAMFKATGRVCFYCSEKVKRIDVDHFIPLARGGSNWPDNLVLACKTCNRSKGAKMPWEWMPERFSPGCTPR